MNSATFTIMLAPVAKGRPKIGRGPGGRARAYTPKKTAEFEAMVRMASDLFLPPMPLEGALSVELEFYLKRPKRLTKKKHGTGKVKHDKRPDIDNLVKSVLDGLDQWWGDDAQICELTARKFYCSIDEPRPRINVTIEGAR